MYLFNIKFLRVFILLLLFLSRKKSKLKFIVIVNYRLNCLCRTHCRASMKHYGIIKHTYTERGRFIITRKYAKWIHALAVVVCWWCCRFLRRVFFSFCVLFKDFAAALCVLYLVTSFKAKLLLLLLLLLLLNFFFRSHNLFFLFH